MTFALFANSLCHMQNINSKLQLNAYMCTQQGEKVNTVVIDVTLGLLGKNTLGINISQLN
jgi:hypothetical protein